MLHIRKSLMLREVLTSEIGKSGARPIVRAVALTVIGNPFAGRYVDVGEPGGISERIAAGHWPYARSRRVPYAPNPHAPPFDTLPPRVQELMRRCFEDGHARSAHRLPLVEGMPPPSTRTASRRQRATPLKLASSM